MKCSYFNLNICFLALFVMFCIANSIMIENNNILKGNNVISKPESNNLLKVFQMKKVAQNELKILKMKRDKIDKSMKRLSFLSTENDDERTSLNNDKLSLIISLSALFIGFIFAGVFLMMAYLLSE